jgi:hypothetical protein
LARTPTLQSDYYWKPANLNEITGGSTHPMDFDGPAPFVVGDRGGTSSIFGDALTISITAHHRLPNMTAPRKDANTRFPRSTATIWRLRSRS